MKKEDEPRDERIARAARKFTQTPWTQIREEIARTEIVPLVDGVVVDLQAFRCALHNVKEYLSLRERFAKDDPERERMVEFAAQCVRRAIEE